MSDGSWKQVVVNNTDGYIKVIVDVDDDPSRNSYRKQSLTEYNQFPFSAGQFILNPFVHFLYKGCLLSFLLVSCFIESFEINANSVGPDQMLHSAASELGLQLFANVPFMGR